VTATLIVLGVLLVVLAWLMWGGRSDTAEPTANRRADATDAIDRAELDRAEQDVQGAPDEESVRDWGPGAGRPKPPELL
jgi:hypothetical protein